MSPPRIHTTSFVISASAVFECDMSKTGCTVAHVQCLLHRVDILSLLTEVSVLYDESHKRSQLVEGLVLLKGRPHSMLELVQPCC